MNFFPAFFSSLLQPPLLPPITSPSSIHPLTILPFQMFVPSSTSSSFRPSSVLLVLPSFPSSSSSPHPFTLPSAVWSPFIHLCSLPSTYAIITITIITARKEDILPSIHPRPFPPRHFIVSSTLYPSPHSSAFLYSCIHLSSHSLVHLSTHLSMSTVPTALTNASFMLGLRKLDDCFFRRASPLQWETAAKCRILG